MTPTPQKDLLLAVAFALLAGALAVINAQGPLFMALRIPLGLAAVLFLPGYTLIAALFPSSKDLDGLERIGLGFGVSVALIPVLATGLSFTPWGIRLVPAVISLSAFVILTSAIAWYRRQGLAPEERPDLALQLAPRFWGPSFGRASLGAKALLILSGLTLTITAVILYQTLISRENYALTEFYLLGPDGLAQGYPREATVGQPLWVTVGIRNYEGARATYRVEVRHLGRPIGSTGPMELAKGEGQEQPVSFTLPQAGKDQEVEFLLFRGNEEQPYRSLSLWMDAKRP